MSSAARVCVVGGAGEELAAMVARVGADVRVLAGWEAGEALAWADVAVADGVVGQECGVAQEMGAMVVSRGGEGDLVVVDEARAREMARGVRSGVVRTPAEGGRGVVMPDELIGRLAVLGRDCVVELEDGVVAAVFEGRAIGVAGMGGAAGSAVFLAMLAVRWAEHRVGGAVDQAAIADALDWACAARAVGERATRAMVRERLVRG